LLVLLNFVTKYSYFEKKNKNKNKKQKIINSDIFFRE
jgi:hypothetical protein